VKHTPIEVRREYSHGVLSKAGVDASPFNQFRRWFQESIEAQIPDTNAMILATADHEGMPSARVVLLKEFDESGFVFYTNYASHKGVQLTNSPKAALVFYWKELDRQVRIQGTVTITSRGESDAYFKTRPFGSRIGAVASRQSRVVANRRVLEERFKALMEEFSDGEIPLPAHWGGYRLAPVSVEFWQGRENRLHDRLRYRLDRDSLWIVERLEP
jgi:pyridoxamine 5'-phosphate oxidase